MGTEDLTSEEITAMLAEEGGLFNAETVTYYVRSGEGKMYKEIPRPGSDGEFDYVEADPTQSYVELPNGKYVTMADSEEAARQRMAGSHRRYFDNLEQDPKAAKRNMKRREILQRQLEQIAIDRVTPPTGPNVEIVKDERALELLAQYRIAHAAGKGKECEFQPFSVYQSKLVTSSGRVVRPPYQGEVGMLGSRVICLESGYGTGAFAAVGAQIGGIAHVVSGERQHQPNDGGGDDRSGDGVEAVPGEEGGDETP